MRARAFNPQIFLELLCYSVFGGLVLYLVRSGKYLSYVTPRMEPYLYFTATVMGIWVFAGLGRLFRPQHKIRSNHCFVLAIPVILLLLPHASLNTSNLSGNYTGRNIFSSQSSQSLYGTSASQKQSLSDNSGFSSNTVTPTKTPLEDLTEPANDIAGTNLTSTDTETTDSIDTTVQDTQTDVPEEETLADLPGLDVADKKITVSNDDFGMWYSEIYVNMEKYEGYTIVITGYVFKDPELFKKDEFVPARLMMSCCVADLSPTGFTCEYNKASELKPDSWVTVEGTLHKGQYEYNGEKYDEPQISVKKITPAKEVDGYVYPYF
jgi:putative membrane protein